MRITRLAAFVLLFCLLAACSAPEGPGDRAELSGGPSPTARPEGFLDEGQTPDRREGTIRVACDELHGAHNPFYADCDGERTLRELVFDTLLVTDRTGEPVLKGLEGESRVYSGILYAYSGIADCEIAEAEDGSAELSFTLREDVLFSDGQPLTARDVLFSMYVYADPAYSGDVAFAQLPIEGLEAYRGGTASLWRLIFEDLGRESPENGAYYTEEERQTFCEALRRAGCDFAQEIVDYCVRNYSGYCEAYAGCSREELEQDAGRQVLLGMHCWGYCAEMTQDRLITASGAEFDLRRNRLPTTEDFWNEILSVCGYDLSPEGLEYESAGTSFADTLTRTLLDLAPELTAYVPVGETASVISGLEQTGLYTFTVRLTELRPDSLRKFCFPVAPLHVYGAGEYDPARGIYGLEKGCVYSLREEDLPLIGSGPYVLNDSGENSVLLAADGSWWGGRAKTGFVELEVCPRERLAEALTEGEFDLYVSDLESGAASVAGGNRANDVFGGRITALAWPSGGYGYIGMRADTVCVGEDPAGEASRNLRRGLAVLLAEYREEAVSGYYGDRAIVLNESLANEPLAASDASEAFFFWDVDGNQIYTENMSDSQRKEAALQACVGYLKAAGYDWDDTREMFVAPPEDGRIEFEFWIPGEGAGNHPAWALAMKAAEVLKSIGIKMTVLDMPNMTGFWAGVDGGQADLWAASWSEDVTADRMYSGEDTLNSFRLTDEELDGLTAGDCRSADAEIRGAALRRCREIVEDWAVELPFYRKENALLLHKGSFAELPQALTLYYPWTAEAPTMELG